jgi:hypothetical protein
VAANYPGANPAFTPKVDGVDYPQAADVNAAYDEITAIGTALRDTGLEHNLFPESSGDARTLGTTSKFWGLSYLKGLTFTAAAEVTIASGVVTASQSYLRIDTESDAAADDLDTITYADCGLIILRAENVARVVTLKDGTGNLLLSGDCALSATDRQIILIYDGTNWREIARSSGSATSKPFLVFTAAHNNPPASNPATPDTRNAHPVLDFDGSTDEEAVFPGVLPTGYAGGGLTCEVFVSFTSATSGSVRFQAAIERVNASGLDVDADSFEAFQSAGGTAPGTSGHVIVVTIAFTAGSQMDSLAAGEMFRLKIRRDADGTSGTDDITTDCELHRVVLREP